MCLILFKFDPSGDYPLTVVANRDEFHRRPTEQAHFWDDHPDVLAGRDMEKGGTWMGVTKSGRFAAVTNYRSPRDMKAGGRSRGELPVGFLTGVSSSLSYLETVMADAEAYAGFNLLVYDGQALGYASNRSADGPHIVKEGIHGLSNALLDTDWPKVEHGREALRRLDDRGAPDPTWLSIMADTTQAPDAALPDTGVGVEKERLLSARCIVSEDYGTRCSSFVSIRRDGRIEFQERTLIPEGLNPDTVRFVVEPG